MSRTRIAAGSDEHGRPKGRWTEAEPVTTPYGFMEPAIPPTIERRKATDEEMAAARAREAEPSHLTTNNSRTVPIGIRGSSVRPAKEPDAPAPEVVPGTVIRIVPAEAPVIIDELHVWPTGRAPGQLPAVEPAPAEPAAVKTRADHALAIPDEPAEELEPTAATLAILADAVAVAAEAWAEKLQNDHLADQAHVRWTEARRALDAAYRALDDPPRVSPSVYEITTAAMLFHRGALEEARASVALEGETQVVQAPRRDRSGEGQRPGQASARDRRAATVMSAMGRLDDDMDAVAAELGMRKNAVAQVVKHARIRAGTAP